MKDKYDEAVDYLTQHPDQIYKAWQRMSSHEAGCLFKFVTDVPGSGCLTMVHSVPKEFTGGEWHDEIVADKRIPCAGSEIKVEDLPVLG